eukprot:scpid44199/ scgid28099/ 
MRNQYNKELFAEWTCAKHGKQTGTAALLGLRRHTVNVVLGSTRWRERVRASNTDADCWWTAPNTTEAQSQVALPTGYSASLSNRPPASPSSQFWQVMDRNAEFGVRALTGRV